jgi:hypothetical protein
MTRDRILEHLLVLALIAAVACGVIALAVIIAAVVCGG